MNAINHQSNLLDSGAIAVALTNGSTTEHAIAIACCLNGIDPVYAPLAFKLEAQRIYDIQHSK